MSAAVPNRLRQSGRDRVMITPEGIALPITVAGKGARAGALVLDFIIIFLLMLGFSLALIYIAGGVGNLAQSMDQKASAFGALEFLIVVWILAMFLFRNAYFLFFELGPRGATPGKRMAGIRIASRDGGRLTVDMVLARNLLRDIELFLPLVFLSAADEGSMGEFGLAGAVWFLIFAFFPFFNKDRLRAGDIVAGSWVVETPRRKLEDAMTKAREARVQSGVAGVAYRFSDEDLSVYGEYELQTLERVLRDDRREGLESVYAAICNKIGWSAGAGDEREFLEAYYVQLRARLEANMRLGKRKADKFS